MYYRPGRSGGADYDARALIIPRERLQHRRLYRLDSRNLGPVAVATVDVSHRWATHGLIGIREKFNHYFLATEWHCDGEYFRTAIPWEELPDELPPEIECREYLTTTCKHCGFQVEWRSDKTGTHDGPPPGRDHHVPDMPACQNAAGQLNANAALYTWLQAMELKYAPPGYVPGWLDPQPVQSDP